MPHPDSLPECLQTLCHVSFAPPYPELSIARVFSGCNQLPNAIVMAGIAMFLLDDYVIDVLMRDLVGHDRRPVSFLVYLWLAGEYKRRKGEVKISYKELAECIGVSKSSAQAAVGWLIKRKLLAANRQSVT